MVSIIVKYKETSKLLVGDFLVGGPLSTPGSSTDNAVVRWDGTGGSAVQDSGVLIDDSDNVTGVTSLDIDGSGTTALNVGSGNVLVVDTVNGYVGINRVPSVRTMELARDDAVTSAVTSVYRMSHTTSGTAAAGFGVGMEFELEGADTTNLVAGEINVEWTSAATGAEEADMVFNVATGGAPATELLRLVGTGDMHFNRDGDSEVNLGRASIHSNVASDWAVFSHYDQRNSSTNWAFAQLSSGLCFFNAPLSQGLRFATGGSTKWTIAGASGGNFLPVSNNSFDIGSSSTAVRDLYMASDILMNDDGKFIMGTGSDASIGWNTTQTNDSVVIGLGNTSRTLIICEEADTGTNFALGNSTHPAVYIYNAGGTANMFFFHDGTNASIHTDTGDIDFNRNLEFSSGVATDATDYQIGRNADGTNLMFFNVPTGAGFEWSINDGSIMDLDATDGLKINNNRIQGAKGADVASGNNITLGNDGNYFDITGTTQINTIAATNWQAGSIIVLQFDASVTVAHNTAGTGASILLSGSGNFSATANDTLMLIYDGTTWREVSRTVI